MIKYTIFASAAVMLLLASPAQAKHCEAEIADVETLLAAPATDDTNRLDAAEALLDHAITTCGYEEQQMADADFDSPLLEPGYVTVGRSMLIAAGDLTQGN